MDTLYPPTELQAENWASQIYVHWNKPEIPGGGTPAGLVGYYIYRNGLNIFYVNDPDYLSYIDVEIDPGLYIYKATAYYDLTTYGYPGQYAESAFSNSDTTYGGCACPSLWEPWDQASYNYNDWIFSPGQGNWDISITEGNPLPTAVFLGNPASANFDQRLVSRRVSSGFICANYIVDFDLKMEAVTPGNSAQLFFEIYYDSTWFIKDVFDNINTDGWIHHTYDITADVTEATWYFFRVGFRAAGDTSTVIGSWMIDNIRADFYCTAPDSMQYDLAENQVNLFWNQPCRKADTIVYPEGFNIFRTDSTGLPPYYQLNTELITDTFYVDTIYDYMMNGEFRYCMNVVYNECISDTSASILVSIPVGTDEHEKTVLQVFPNPVSGVLQIQSETALETVTLWSMTCVVRLQVNNLKDKRITIPVDNLPEGVYWVGVLTGNSYVIRKVMVIRP